MTSATAVFGRWVRVKCAVVSRPIALHNPYGDFRNHEIFGTPEWIALRNKY